MPHSTSVAIFSIDPGGTTGCAKALIDLRQITVQKCIRRAVVKGNIETWVEKGSSEAQSWALAQGIVEFLFNVHIERSVIENRRFYVVIEGFRIQQMGADLAPVEVAAGLQTLLMGAFKDRWGSEDFYQKQFASEAKGFCTDKMLDKWGLLKGRTPHERDALRHLARRIDKLLKEAT
jgi:hypothetical protein